MKSAGHYKQKAKSNVDGGIVTCCGQTVAHGGTK